MARRYSLDSEQIDAVAEAADVSARSVRRYLGGASMLASSMRRIERALRAAGLDDHVRSEARAA